MIRILSLGAGVQSTVVYLMSARGELPRLDHAIFADTGWEPMQVYRQLKWLQEMDAGIPIHVVSKGNLREHTINGWIRGKKEEGTRYASLPLRVLNPDGSQGMIRRQCTREYKVEPIERFVKNEILGLETRARWPKEHTVDQWFGISVDEASRMRDSDKPWKRHVYPLVGLPETYLPKPLTRGDCIEWLRTNYPECTVTRSACIGCPFHDDRAWRDMKRNRPDEWADAVEVDEAVRHADGMGGQVFLHRSCKPLAEVDLESDVDKGQDTFGWDEECLGYCGD